MTVAHDASTRWPTTENTADTTTGNRTITHTPSGTPAGVTIVLCCTGTTEPVTGIKYGALALDLVASAIDTSEAGSVYIYRSPDGAVIPTGSKTVTFLGCTSVPKFATINTQTSATNFTSVNASNVVNTTTSGDPTINLTTSTDTMSYAGIHTGSPLPSSVPGTGVTLQNNRDYGALAANTVRRTSVDASGTVTISVSLASDDHCIAAVAIAESAQIVSPLFGGIGTQQQGNTTGSTMSVDIPDDVAIDDIILVTAFVGDNTTVTAMPPGFTDAPNSPVEFIGPGGTDRLFVAQKVAIAADVTTGTYDFTLSGDVYTNAAASRYPNADTSSIWDFTNSAVDNASGTASPAVSGTTSVDNTLLIWTSINWIGGTWTAPSGFSKRRDTGDRNTTLADKRQLTAGATGSISGSCTGSGSRATWIGALKPAGGSTNLTVANATQAQSAENVVLTQDHVLAVNNATQAQTAENVALTQNHILVVDSANQAQTAENVTISETYVLSVNAASQAQTAENVSLTQNHILSMDSSTHGQSAENVSLTQVHGLTVNSSAQAQTTENVLLTQNHVLVVDSTTQTQIVDSPTFTQNHVLSVDFASQNQSSENLNLTQNHILAVNDSSQNQTSENVDLPQGFLLSVANSFQGQSSENVDLTQVHILSVNDSVQNQATDNVVLNIGATIVVHDALQTQNAENVNLTQDHILSLQNSLQTQTVDNVSLSVDGSFDSARATMFMVFF